MGRKLREVKEGFELEFESLMVKKNNLEEEKALAIETALLAVEERFKGRAKTIESLLELISVELPEEVEEERGDLATEEPLEPIKEGAEVVGGV